MNDRIVSITFPTCGKCRFAQKPDAKGMYECNGNPPIPLILGTSQDALGRPQFHIEAMVPKVWPLERPQKPGGTNSSAINDVPSYFC